MDGVRKFLDHSERDMRGLKQAMSDGNYQFQNSYLAYMRVIEAQDERVLPFQHLLWVINAIHRTLIAMECEAKAISPR